MVHPFLDEGTKAIKANFSDSLHCTRVVQDSAVVKLSLTLAYRGNGAVTRGSVWPA
jgi:hypothetical protein